MLGRQSVSCQISVQHERGGKRKARSEHWNDQSKRHARPGDVAALRECNVLETGYVCTYVCPGG